MDESLQPFADELNKEFRGAIPISPGGREYPEFDTLKPVADNKSQGYICLCGGEAPGNVLLPERSPRSPARPAAASSWLSTWRWGEWFTWPAMQ